METTNLADLYGLPTIDWAIIEDRLARGFSQAPGRGDLIDTRAGWRRSTADGSPTCDRRRCALVRRSLLVRDRRADAKGKKPRTSDPRWTLSLATHEFDLVIEGVAEKVTNPAVVATMAEQWSAQGWPAQVDASGVASPSPLSTAPHLLDLPRGRSTASRRTMRLRS